MTPARWLGILLVLSLLFNVFYAGGAIQAEGERKVVSAETGVVDKVAERLDLDAAQRQAFLDLKRSGEEQAERLQGDLAEARQQLLAALGARTLDQEGLAELQEFEARQRLEHRLQMGERLRQFMDLLTAEQRRQMAEMLQERLQGTPPGRFLMRRWDADKDGRLSDEERAAARQGFRRRMQESRATHPATGGPGPRGGRPGIGRGAGPGPGDGQRREMMLRRFDRDGDGVLSPEERAQAAEATPARGEGNAPAPQAEQP